MKRRLLPVLAVAFAAAFLPALVSAAPLAQNQTIKLPCGRTIKVLSITQVESSKGLPALMVRYQTTLSVDERKALSEEVDDVWKLTVKDVEHDGFTEAIISSNEIPKGIILKSSRLLNFVYDKGADGSWTRLGRSDFMAAQ